MSTTYAEKTPNLGNNRGSMRAAVFTGPGQLQVVETPRPRLGRPEDVLIRVEACGVCGTDLHILSVPPGHPGTCGTTLGHEYVGAIEAVGPAVTHVKPGDRVVVDPNLRCGVCRYCQDGLPNQCENFTTLGIFEDGGFAEYNVAPARAVYPIPKELVSEMATFVEPLSCVLNATSELRAQPGDTAVVLGGGPIGLYFAMVLRASGATKVIVSEFSEHRRPFAAKIGASRVVNPLQEDLVSAVHAELGDGADIVVDAVGGLLDQAMSVARKAGQIVLFGQNLHRHNQVVPYWITRHELTIKGSYIARNTFPRAIKILTSGLLPVEKLITHRVDLDGIVGALEDMKSGRAMRIVAFPDRGEVAGS